MRIEFSEKGELCLDAESPVDGLELARLAQEAENLGAKVEIVRGKNGEVSLGLTLAIKPGPKKKTKTKTNDGPETENGDGNRQPEPQPEVNDPAPETTR